MGTKSFQALLLSLAAGVLGGVGSACQVILPDWAGEPLDSYQKILNYARTTRTQTGLRVTAYLDRRYYACGLKPSPDQIASLRLQRHETLPEWNYTIKPQL